MSLNCNVNLYKIPPSSIENLYALEEMAYERLCLYKILLMDFNPSEYKTLELRHLLDENKPDNIKEIRRKDIVSHYLLKLVYSSSQSLQKTFIQLERKWFRLRFIKMPSDEQDKFFNDNFTIPLITEPEKLALNIEDGAQYYKVHYTLVPSLLRKREVLLKDGTAYFSEKQILDYILDCFSRFLKKSIADVPRVLPTLKSNCCQIAYLLEYLEPVTYSKCFSSRQLTLDILDEHARTKFPLCAKIQHDHLRHNHHLKYPSRQQYGLFLKGAALSLEEVLILFRNEFKKKMSEDQFNKRYRYYFRHLYGTVGSCIDYEPLNCNTILSTPVTFGQVNGCPFKTFSVAQLKRQLLTYSLQENQIEDVLKFKSANNFKKACTACFRFSQNREPQQQIQHPNQYYENSCEIVDIEDIYVND